MFLFRKTSLLRKQKASQNKKEYSMQSPENGQRMLYFWRRKISGGERENCFEEEGGQYELIRLFRDRCTDTRPRSTEGVFA
jgi:hypothetical protein